MIDAQPGVITIAVKVAARIAAQVVITVAPQAIEVASIPIQITGVTEVDTSIMDTGVAFINHFVAGAALIVAAGEEAA